MSLVSTVPETDAAVAAVPKARRQIHAYSDSSTSIVRYTVPEGRKFVGQAVGKNTGSKLYLVVEGADSTATNSEMFVGKAGESYNFGYLQLELMAGTQVKLYYTHLIGIESDE
mgnify:CR=1 FL=1|jgi:hypothetical protein